MPKARSARSSFTADHIDELVGVLGRLCEESMRLTAASMAGVPAGYQKALTSAAAKLSATS